MPVLNAELFFPSRRSQRLEKQNRSSILDVEEATGAPRLTTCDLFGPESRIGLLCANNPVNWSDPFGLAATQKLDGSPSDDDPNIPTVPRIIVHGSPLDALLDPAVSLGNHGSCAGCGGGGAGRGGKNNNDVANSPAQNAAKNGAKPKEKESLYDCLNRHAQAKYGDALQLSDNLGLYGLGTFTYTSIASSALARATQSATTSVINNAPLAGVREGGTIPQRMFAADEAAALAGRLSAGQAVIGALSKASGVITFGATSFSVGARLEFLSECSGGGN